MSQASIQILTSNIFGEEPFIGDLDEGELFGNNSDGRLWMGDSLGSPIEIGGAVKNKPAGSLLVSNYLSVDLSQADNLPVPNTNPLSVPEGFYRELRLLILFSQAPVTNTTAYFDYPIDWGEKNSWFIFSSDATGSSNAISADETADNPIDAYKAEGRKILIELSSFGPNDKWMGRLLWINNI